MNTDNFLVTSHGRSGTKWLTDICNRSKKWSVVHDTKGGLPFSDKLYCGEISGYRRVDLDKFKGRKFIIMRDPKEVLLSAINRHPETIWNTLFLSIGYWHMYFISQINNFKCEPISFRRMTTDVDYANYTISSLGIDDVEVTQQDLDTPKNVNKNIKYKKLPKHLAEPAKKFYPQVS